MSITDQEAARFFAEQEQSVRRYHADRSLAVVQRDEAFKLLEHISTAVMIGGSEHIVRVAKNVDTDFRTLKANAEGK